MPKPASAVISSYSKEFLTTLYREMVSIREFEEQVQDLYNRTLIPGIAHLSSGQEAVAVGMCAALRAEDYITSTHRGHGHCLAKGADPARMFAELFGRVDGYCRGKGGSMHIANQDAGNLGANAIVGGGISIATGAALSAKLQKTDRVSVCLFGDGALNQGILFESMNMAALWRLPVIYVCENNQYTEYLPMQQLTAGEIITRGKAFGIPSAEVDGMNVLAVYESAQVATQRARAGEGASFLLMDTYRYYGHGMSDRNRPYRSREEEGRWRSARDPIECLANLLIEAGDVTQEHLASIQIELRDRMQAAIAFAMKSPFPEPEEVQQHVYAD
jgi:pyruvate dehydrogenase E1 component alpha subunit